MMQEEKCRIAKTPSEEWIHQVILKERETREIYTCKGIVKSQKPVIKNHISTTPSDPESGQYVCREMQNRQLFLHDMPSRKIVSYSSCFWVRLTQNKDMSEGWEI